MIFVAYGSDSASRLKQLGTEHYYRGEYASALSFYIQALELFEKQAISDSAAFLMCEISNLHRKQGDLDKARIILEKAAKTFSETDNRRGIAVSYDHLGVLYDESGQLDSALFYFERSLSIDRELGFESDIPFSLLYAASVHSRQNNFSKAEEYYREALGLRRKLGDMRGLAIALNDLGEMYLMKKEYRLSEQNLLEAKRLAQETGFRDLEKHIYDMLSKLYSAQGNYSRAFDAIQHYILLKDQIFNEEKSRQIAELQEKYETEKKEHRIAELQSETRAQTLQLERRQLQLAALAVFATLLLLAGLLLFRLQRARQQARLDAALLEEQRVRMKAVLNAQEQERTRVARELHDGVGQMLAGLKMRMGQKSQDAESVEVLDKAYQEVRSISHSMMPRALAVAGLQQALEDLVASTPLKLSLEVLNLQERLPPEVEANLYRICQELITNMLKHSGASFGTIQLYKTSSHIILRVEDNGRGMNGTPGTGMQSIASRTEAMNGTFSVSTSEGGGTEVVIRIPNNL